MKIHCSTVGAPTFAVQCHLRMLYCSVDVDLSKELQAPTRPILQTQVEAARRGRAIGAEVRSLPFIMDYLLSPGDSFTKLE